MTLTANEIPAGHTAAPPVETPRSLLDFDPPMAQFLVNLGAISSLERIGFRSDEQQLDMWVMLRPLSLEDEERVYRLDYEYRRSGGRSDVHVHVLGLDRLDPEALPDVDGVIERSRD